MSHEGPPTLGGCLTVLGIETSCDETAAALVRRHPQGGAEILSERVLSQNDDHAPFGGVVPEIAARAHVAHLDRLIAAVMAESGMDFKDLDGIAATAGPGLIGGLLVGLTTAKAIALVHDLPLLAINHLEGHALTARLTDGLAFPYLLLLVSGGHTQLLVVEGVGRYSRLGTTIDDALGEAFDKTAKILGLGYPGGPEVERRAKTGDPKRFPFPRPLLGRDGCDFSFSGLKTSLRRSAQSLEPLTEGDVDDICASFQAAISDCVADRMRRAMDQFRLRFPGKTDPVVVVAGGVAANQALRAMMAQEAARGGFTLSIPPLHLCTDNAVMIAWAGAERLALRLTDALDVAARPRWPLDPDAAPAIGAGVKA
ncbi:tRNA (adenosine(37)-N6)-threonylcarbamoyltransferase complex transferase subunit TsaD [Rhodoligotrophos appendicifer]|uniref:tRNA (adenosine(37)-N6)-threonylcarbamoyltransferase complex transferase subunit TsaD n=1 Tax=Rhodoligotrophos appendicifer TaxID=987056 RepID=UPI001180B93B|nr:tRNA (adenosine(37)-N6)-threonylcarbamoyltransferase complex transferase subunit TsaD [Rhodoligotrophos appendicifer]